MKKTFTIWCLVLIAFGYTATAQSTRLVLAEEFTQASCPPCASQNPAFNTLLNANPTKVVAIKYQTSWPGVDPMNAQTQSWVAPRVTYYSVTGVPTATMDGVEQTGGSYDGAPANWTAAKLNARALITSPFTLGVSHSFNTTHDSIFITVDIAATGAVTGNLVAHVAIIEREIPFCNAPGTNGETLFDGVMRAMLPNATGTAISNSWTVGQTQTLTFAAKIPAYTYDKNQLAVVAFIQDNGTSKDVKQAGYSAPQPLTNDAKLVCSSISGIPKISCGTPLSPVVTFANEGTSNLTALTVNYSVDGVAATPIPWTGNLAPAATGTVNLAGVSTANGNHTLQVIISGPNGLSDYNNYYDSASISYSVSTSMGGALPLVQAFGSPNFPPANWININNDNGFGWDLAVQGFNGQGSAMVDFYDSPNLQVDALVTPNFDFSAAGTTSAQIDFDVAHAQYSTSTNDRLQVMYSLDCGATWSQPIYNEAGATLASGNAVNTSAFIPTSTQWHHKTASLTGAVGNSNVFIKFNGVSNYGNNCYIDNVNISTNLTTGVPVIFNNQDISVYPNPSNGAVKVKINLAGSHDVAIVVTNTLGAIVKTMNLNNVSSGVYDVDLTNEAIGSYEVSVKTDEQVVTKRISITH